MNVGDIPRLMVYNKVDLLADDADPTLIAQARDCPANRSVAYVSAKTGQGIPGLLEELEEVLERSLGEQTVQPSTLPG